MEDAMRTHRFGRKLKLPSTIAIKHQLRMLMFKDALKNIEAAGGAEAGGAEAGGAEAGEAEAGGAEAGGAEAREAEAGGAEAGGAEAGGAEAGGAEAGGAESGVGRELTGEVSAVALARDGSIGVRKVALANLVSIRMCS
jgi:hypothetical protein